MHIFFSGIGGTGLGPLAMIAHQAGYAVSGSDKQDSQYIQYLRGHGIDTIAIGQSAEQIAQSHQNQPIDWYVYSSAVAIENPDAPELQFCRQQGIRMSKRDELLSTILADKNLQLIAVAGTQGKTTTTAMAIWLMQQLGIPVSYSVGAKISFGEMGHYEPGSQYFIYEADEFDRNFLAFHPHLALITGIDWDHHDIYPTRDEYKAAFSQFLGQCKQAVLWREDFQSINIPAGLQPVVLAQDNPDIDRLLRLPGSVNRKDAWQVAMGLQPLCNQPLSRLIERLNSFPGVSRRFEQLQPGLYSDYAHTPPKIRGTLETAREVARGGKVVVVYEGLHNTRQHFIKDELKTLFDGVDELYIVPTYLAREDKTLALLSPSDLRGLMSETTQTKTSSAALDSELENAIHAHLQARDTVVCITAGGGGSLDEWLRKTFGSKPVTTA